MNKENIKKVRLLSNINEVGIMCTLPIFKTHEIEARPTDLVILLGGVRDKFGYTPYWTSTAGKAAHAVITSINYSLNLHYEAAKNAKSPAIRPVLEFNKVPNRRLVQFGEYPQDIETNEEIIKELNELENSKVKTTGKKYCLDGENEISEYEFNGNKYVPVVSNANGLLHDGTKAKKGQLYWVKVEPVSWYVSQEKNLLVCTKALSAGIPFWNDLSETNEEKSNMYHFLNTKFLKDIANLEELVDENTIHLLEEGTKRLSNAFARFKTYINNNELCNEEKETVKELIRLNKDISELSDVYIKIPLYRILLNMALDFEYIHKNNSTDSTRALWNFSDILSLLFNCIKFKKSSIDIASCIKDFIIDVSNKTFELCRRDGKYLLEKSDYGYRYLIYQYLYGIIDIILEKDDDEIGNKLIKYAKYDDGKYNDLLAKLDAELQLYDSYNNHGAK